MKINWYILLSLLMCIPSIGYSQSIDSKKKIRPFELENNTTHQDSVSLFNIDTLDHTYLPSVKAPHISPQKSKSQTTQEYNSFLSLALGNYWQNMATLGITFGKKTNHSLFFDHTQNYTGITKSHNSGMMNDRLNYHSKTITKKSAINIKSTLQHTHFSLFETPIETSSECQNRFSYLAFFGIRHQWSDKYSTSHKGSLSSLTSQATQTSFHKAKTSHVLERNINKKKQFQLGTSLGFFDQKHLQQQLNTVVFVRIKDKYKKARIDYGIKYWSSRENTNNQSALLPYFNFKYHLNTSSTVNLFAGRQLEQHDYISTVERYNYINPNYRIAHTPIKKIQFGYQLSALNNQLKFNIKTSYSLTPRIGFVSNKPATKELYFTYNDTSCKIIRFKSSIEYKTKRILVKSSFTINRFSTTILHTPIFKNNHFVKLKINHKYSASLDYTSICHALALDTNENVFALPYIHLLDATFEYDINNQWTSEIIIKNILNSRSSLISYYPPIGTNLLIKIIYNFSL